MRRPTRISPNPLAQVLQECMPLPAERAVVSSWIESGRVGRLGEAESFFASVLAIPGAEEALAALDLERTGEQELLTLSTHCEAMLRGCDEATHSTFTAVQRRIRH